MTITCKKVCSAWLGGCTERRKGTNAVVAFGERLSESVDGRLNTADLGEEVVRDESALLSLVSSFTTT
jgi:hypothetical protein